MYEPPQKAFLRCNRKSSKNIIEVLKYWAHIWKDSGRKFGLFWNAVVFGEHLLYESKPDARAKHQGTIIGTIPEECVEDAILMLKKKKKKEEKEKKKEKLQKAEMERERILQLLEKFLQNK